MAAPPWQASGVEIPKPPVDRTKTRTGGVSGFVGAMPFPGSLKTGKRSPIGHPARTTPELLSGHPFRMAQFWGAL
jgi:hypothetical protein